MKFFIISGIMIMNFVIINTEVVKIRGKWIVGKTIAEGLCWEVDCKSCDYSHFTCKPSQTRI